MPLRRVHLLGLLFVLLGATIRFWGLGSETFTPREVAWIAAADGLPPSADGPGLPTAPLLSRWMTQLALRHGYGEATVRLPSAVAGTAVLLTTWLLALWVFGAESAVYATLLLACSPLHIGVSREIGPEPWLTFATVTTMLALFVALQEPEKVSNWLGVVAMAAVACISGYAGLFVPAASVAILAVLALREHRLRTRGAAASAAMSLAVAAVLVWTVYGRPQPGVSLFPLELNKQLLVLIPRLFATGDQVRPGSLAAALSALALLACAIVGGIHAVRSTSRGALILAWAGIGTAAVIVADWMMGYAFEASQLVLALPAYLILCAAGASWLRQRTGVGVSHWGAAAAQTVIAILVVVTQLPGLVPTLHSARPRWREVAGLVRANVQGGDTIVVLLQRATFTFYAPDLEPRVEPQVRPAFASSYFVHPERGWLIAPAEARLYQGWQQLERWLQQFPPIDLSADPRLGVFYVGQAPRNALLSEVAYFDLPVATLARGTLLIDLLMHVGPTPPVLWKVDQLALSRGVDLHNPHLLEAVSSLAERGHGDRAASLAYRLATADPAWAEAQHVLAAFQAAPHEPEGVP